MRVLAKPGPQCKKLNKIVENISREIAERGTITLARFMELALYCPVFGYYEREENTAGQQGDFYTSVSVGNLFGQLLAWQFAEWLGESKVQSSKSKVSGSGFSSRKSWGVDSQAGGKVQIVEAGAHDGRLARDILVWLHAERPELFHRLEYWIIEPSARRRDWQQRTLADFMGQVRWVPGLEAFWASPKSKVQGPNRGPAFSGIRGIIFSNELLDSFPVHRLGWDAQERTWFEWGVTLQGGRFVWARMQEVPFLPNGSTLQHASKDLLAVLPDGFTFEVCPAAEQWWQAAAEALECGKLLTIDYGLTTQEFLMPEREDGTLRGYHRHRFSTDLLAQPGEQDLTAHVNFSALQATGETAGLRTEAFVSQERFLTEIAARAWQDKSDLARSATRQFQTLVHPEHLGRAFRVLVQSR
jgi:SAM-dependent MidA family methyltransferase